MEMQTTSPAIPAPPRSPERDVFQMEWLLPRVEKQIDDLPADGRLRVIHALLNPVSAVHCERFRNGDRRDVYHFGVGRALRICFSVRGGGCVVVFVGPHRKCDIFVDKFCGKVTGRLIPIKESVIMSMKKNTNGNKPGAAPGPLASVSPDEASPSFSDWMRMLPGVIDRTYGQKVRQVEDVCLAEMDGVTARIEGVRAEVGGVTARVETLGERFDSQHQEVSGRVAMLSREVNESNQRTHSVRHDSQTRVAALAGDLAALKGELKDQGRRSTEQVDSVFVEFDALSEKLDTLSRSVVDVAGRYQDLERTSNDAIDAIQGQLAVLEARDQAGPLVARLTQHNDRLDSQDRAVQGALADSARCLEKFASLRDDMEQFKEIACGLTRGMSELGRMVGSLSNQVESAARQHAEREERTIAARLSRWIERIRTGLRSRWTRVMGYAKAPGYFGHVFILRRNSSRKSSDWRTDK